MATKTCLLIGSILLAPALALAAPPAGSGSAAPATSGAPAASGSAKPFHETPEQHAFRSHYVSTTSTHTNEIIHKDNKAFIKDERTLVNEHWRRAMRALRIRDLAEDDGQKDVIARVDKHLTKLDDRLFGKLTQLNAKAPPRPAPPVVVSPAANGSIPVADAYSFKLAPAADMKHTCVLVQVDGTKHRSWVEFSKTPDECSFPATSTQHVKFDAGKVHLHVWAHQATPQGEIYSEAANVNFDLTGPGGAAPVSSGGPK